MKIICISDTHGLHERLNVPDGDVLIHAGDFMGNGWYPKSVSDFNTWLGRQPHPHKFVIPGNHDEFVGIHPDESRQMISNATLLLDDIALVHGVKIWGGSLFAKSKNAKVCLKRADERRRIYEGIPDDTAILVTHKPPLHILDGRHMGEKELRRFYDRPHPHLRLHVFGHEHSSYGTVNIVRNNFAPNMLFVNAALLGPEGRLHFRSIEVDFSQVPPAATSRGMWPGCGIGQVRR